MKNGYEEKRKSVPLRLCLHYDEMHIVTAADTAVQAANAQSIHRKLRIVQLLQTNQLSKCSMHYRTHFETITMSVGRELSGV